MLGMARTSSDKLGVPPCHARTSRICTAPAGAGATVLSPHPLGLICKRRNRSARTLCAGGQARWTIQRRLVERQEVDADVGTGKISCGQVPTRIMKGAERRGCAVDPIPHVAVERLIPQRSGQAEVATPRPHHGRLRSDRESRGRECRCWPRYELVALPTVRCRSSDPPPCSFV